MSLNLATKFKMSCDDDSNGGSKLLTSIISCNQGEQETQGQKPTSAINIPKTPVSLLQVSVECEVRCLELRTVIVVK